jgi:hypothetical protein
MLNSQIYLFDTSSPKLEDLKEVSSENEDIFREGKLVCSICKHVITFESERTDIHGQHRHHFTNPGGYSFYLGCFNSAPGCAEVGLQCSEHTWFPGTRWQISVCASCGEHLGWKYSGSNEFHGLVLTRLEYDAGDA